MTVLVRARLVNLGLLALSLLSLGLVLWTERLPTSLDRQVRERHLLELFRREDVQRLEVREGDRRTVLVRRPAPASPHLLEKPEADREPGAADVSSPAHDPADADGVDVEAEWSLSEPFETDADTVPVDKLLGALQYATWERAVDAPVAASNALATHELVVVMGAASYRLRLGADALSPAGARYVDVSNGAATPRTYVVKKRVLDELFIEGDSFRGRQIVPYRKSSIARVVLTSAAGVRRLRRAGSDFLFDGMQDNQRAEHHALDRLFLGLARARRAVRQRRCGQGDDRCGRERARLARAGRARQAGGEPRVRWPVSERAGADARHPAPAGSDRGLRGQGRAAGATRACRLARRSPPVRLRRRRGRYGAARGG